MILMLFFGCLNGKPSSMDTGIITDTDTDTESDTDTDTDTDTNECDADETVDCSGACSPSAWLADGECDDVFDCAALNYDEGDCDEPDTTDPDGCESAPDIGMPGTFQSEQFDVEWTYDPSCDCSSTEMFYFNATPDLQSVSFTIDAGAEEFYYGYFQNGDNILISNSENKVNNFYTNYGTVLLPISPDTEVSSGCTDFVAVLSGDRDGMTSRLHVNSRRFSQGNSYILNFIVVNGSTFSAEDIDETWSQTDAFLSTVGLNIDQTYSFTVETGDGSFIAPNSEAADRIVATSSDVATDIRELNVFFVDSLGGDLYGYAGGIPGPLAVPGTSSSGVLISIDTHRYSDGSLDYQEMGATISHELGHQLGLFHTTEADGSGNDILSDTPECNLEDDDNEDGYLEPSECPDGDHVMFWTTPGEAFDQDVWSAQQTEVLLNNVVIVEE